MAGAAARSAVRGLSHQAAVWSVPRSGYADEGNVDSGSWKWQQTKGGMPRPLRPHAAAAARKAEQTAQDCCVLRTSNHLSTNSITSSGSGARCWPVAPCLAMSLLY